MNRLVVSAPFGNYVQPDFATATLGTFTAQRRPGRLWRIVKTVRYYPRLRAWVNQIGLRNPGIDWLVAQVAAGRKDLSRRLVSVHGFHAAEWWQLLDRVATLRPLGVELNMSCPNVGEIDWPADLFSRAVGTGLAVVVKLPPVCYEDLFAHALAAGVRRFHACNTLPIPAGGLSGAPLKPLSLACIRTLFHLAGPALAGDLRIVGGGGVREPADVDDYAGAGVHAVAVGTKVMNPRYLFGSGPLRALHERAVQRLAGRPPFFEDPVPRDLYY